jgi:hypothetical protein
MRQQKFRSLLLLPFLILCFCINVVAQTTITGPACVIPGLAIQYNISGKWTANSTVEICVKNGKLQSNGAACYKGKPVSYIRVIWDNSGTNGSISLTSADGNAAQSVKITRQLKAGIIDAISESQQIEKNKTPETIRCSPALWGTCNPSYKYQWQRSQDGISWTDISGEIKINLTISAPLNETVYYRRKVTETNTNTIGYSNVAFVHVKKS